MSITTMGSAATPAVAGHEPKQPLPSTASPPNSNVRWQVPTPLVDVSATQPQPQPQPQPQSQSQSQSQSQPQSQPQPQSPPQPQSQPQPQSEPDSRQQAEKQAQQTQPLPSARLGSAHPRMPLPPKGSSIGSALGQAQMVPLNRQTAVVPSDGNAARSSPQAQQTPLGVPDNSVPQFAVHRSPTTHDAQEPSPEYCELSSLVSRTRPQVVRHVIRDFWNACLLGSQFHTAFVASTTFCHASQATLDRAVQDHGERMVRSSKRHVVAHLTTEDFDEVADLIFAKASNAFLDKAMARRLETIPARPLVNALARAERLGYDVQDIVEETTTNGVERVFPSLQPMTAPSVPSRALTSQASRSQPALAPTTNSQAFKATTLPQRQTSKDHNTKSPSEADFPPPNGIRGQDGIIRCSRCQRPCSGDQAFRYHAMRRACNHTHKVDRLGKDICPHCGSIFTGSCGLTYHIKSKVCGDYTDAIQQLVLEELRANVHKSNYADQGASAPVTPTPTSLPLTSGQTVTAATNGAMHVSDNGNGTPSDGPYAKLDPVARRSFEYEMRKAEEKYGGLMREAMKLPEKEREEELTKLKNSFNSKQSVTRKKYGIRLRERRSKAEIEMERNRLLGSPLAGASSSEGAAQAPAPKRLRISSDGQAAPAQEVGHAGEVEVNRAHKRAGAADLSGGLADTSAAATHTDPTTLLTPSGPRTVAQSMTPKGTSEDPMQIDDSSDNSTDTDAESDDSGSGSDDDIPAKLPTNKV